MSTKRTALKQTLHLARIRIDDFVRSLSERRRPPSEWQRVTSCQRVTRAALPEIKAAMSSPFLRTVSGVASFLRRWKGVQNVESRSAASRRERHGQQRHRQMKLLELEAALTYTSRRPTRPRADR